MNAVILNPKKEVASRVPVSTDNKRVYVTLSKEVVEKLEEMAREDMRSLSSMTARIVVKGLKATEEEKARVTVGQ